MSLTDSRHNDISDWQQALAEVTVMESLRLAMCIEQDEIEGIQDFAERKDKFQIKLLSGNQQENARPACSSRSVMPGVATTALPVSTSSPIA